LGSTLPITTGAFLYIYGKMKDDNRMVGASFAVFQAGLITVTYISILKGLTGRAHPDPNDAPLDRGDVSRRFNFGLVRGGIYRGWPSGHVGGTMAVASSLSNYYPEKTWLKALTYFWAGYTMASVSIYHKGTMHWFSDAIAAGFMTYSIGKSVGNFYRNSISENKDHEKFRLWPVQIDDYSGVFLSLSF
ncbi:MAG: phosphatase PAP2 family protein, partial [Bacteroidota bacterium]|nr:phosphatase PAP2 family protein [Bacteroidota bacterium]